MKTIFFTTIIAAMLITLISCKSEAQKDAGDVKENSVAKTDDNQKPMAESPNIPNDIKNILGEWTLVRRLRDDNGNHKIDEDEEKTQIPDVESYMKLNADGTCKFQTVMDGTYEIITEEDGRKRIAIQDLHGDKYPPYLYILSVSETELIINVQLGGSGFDIFKRL